MADLSWVADKATGILIPSGYKAGKLYGLVPTNQYTTGTPANAFDFTFARSSIATRTNEAGAWETMAADVPLLEHPVPDGCPVPVLLQPTRTNLFLNSDVGVTQTITVVSGSVYSMAFYEGAGSIELTGAHTATLTASDHAYSGAITFTATTTSLVCTVTGAANQVQCELGAYPTTYIKTEAATANRALDSMSLTGLITNGILNNTEITVMYDIRKVINNGGGTPILGIRSSGANQNDIGLISGAAGTENMRYWVRQAGVSISDGYLSDSGKLAVAFGVGYCRVYYNGGLIYSGTDTYNGLADRFATDITKGLIEANEIDMFPTALTDAQLIELTT